MGPLVQVGLQYGARAEHGVPDPLSGGEHHVPVRRGQGEAAAPDLLPGLPEQPLPGRLGKGEQGRVDLQQEAGGVLDLMDRNLLIVMVAFVTLCGIFLSWLSAWVSVVRYLSKDMNDLYN